MSSNKVVIAVVVGVVVMFVSSIAACGGLFYFLYQNTNSKFSPIVDDIFTAVQADEGTRVYREMTSPEFQQSVSQDHFQDICDEYKKLGNLNSKTMTSFNVNYQNGQQLADLTYNAEFERGPGVITAKFRQLAGDWKIVSIYIDSDHFAKSNLTFTCSECESAVGQDDDSCPHCGTAFREPAA